MSLCNQIREAIHDIFASRECIFLLADKVAQLGLVTAESPYFPLL